METPHTNEYNQYPKATAQFNRDTAGHEMEILHEDGLYRHLRFKTPGESHLWFDIVTWPGNLTINGDMGTYQFAREPDMFGWFGVGNINPGYWAEKLRAANYGRYDGDSVRRYNAKDFKEWLFDRFWDDSREMGNGEARAAWELVRETIFEGWYTNNKSAPDSEGEAISRLQDYHRETREHEFYDWSDAVNSWQDYTTHYLWNCHAITAAIATYRKHKAA